MRSSFNALWSIAARLSRNATLALMAVGILAAAEPAPFISDADWNQPKMAASSAITAAPASPGKALGTMAVALLAIVGLGAGALVLIKRLAVRRAGGRAARHISLVETLPLGVKRSVAVLRLGDQVVLVGSHEHGLSALGTFPASVLGGDAGAAPATTDAAEPAPQPPPANPTGAAFAAVLENLVGRR